MSTFVINALDSALETAGVTKVEKMHNGSEAHVCARLISIAGDIRSFYLNLTTALRRQAIEVNSDVDLTDEKIPTEQLCIEIKRLQTSYNMCIRHMNDKYSVAIIKLPKPR